MAEATTTVAVVALVVVAFPLLLTAFWIGIIRLMSLIGGWGRVAQRYAAGGAPVGGRAFSHVTGMFGMARYKHVLTVVATDDGLYLATRRIFRPGHPPIFIPFSAVVRPRKQTLFYWEFVAFEIDDPALASVRLPSRVLLGTPLEPAA